MPKRPSLLASRQCLYLAFRPASPAERPSGIEHADSFPGRLVLAFPNSRTRLQNNRHACIRFQDRSSRDVPYLSITSIHIEICSIDAHALAIALTAFSITHGAFVEIETLNSSAESG